jgi:hypothetical protein
METTIARVNSRLTRKRLVLALAAFLLALLLSLTAAAAPADDAVTKVQADNPNPPAEPVKLIFVHHSCGSNWLRNNNGGLGIAPCAIAATSSATPTTAGGPTASATIRT